MIASFSEAPDGPTQLTAAVQSAHISAENGALAISSSGMQVAIVVGAIALAALVFAFVLRRQVLAFKTGTPAMNDVAGAVQEGDRKSRRLNSSHVALSY